MNFISANEINEINKPNQQINLAAIFVDRSWPASSGFNPAQVPF